MNIESQQQFFTRNCPKCGKEIKNKNKYQCKYLDRDKKLCRSCTRKDLLENNKEYRELCIANCIKNGKTLPFKGKHHTEENKNALSAARTGIKQGPNKLKGNSGETNSMYGKSVYSVWLEKYGKEIADQKMEKLKKKQSVNSTGENNSMYGKPSPNGSGNGWKGWYKGWFFRSLKELSYMINVIEKENLKWEKGEKLSIKYIDYKGTKRTYRPDFIINDKTLIEIKPIKMHNSPSVISKMNAALEYCKNNNLEYKLIDPIILTSPEILQLYKSHLIKFLSKYDEKFKKIYYF